jgi:hypothetical protein
MSAQDGSLNEYCVELMQKYENSTELDKPEAVKVTRGEDACEAGVSGAKSVGEG